MDYVQTDEVELGIRCFVWMAFILKGRFYKTVVWPVTYDTWSKMLNNKTAGECNGDEEITTLFIPIQ